eukprot:87402-Prymnesium_polylepis.1
MLADCGSVCLPAIRSVHVALQSRSPAPPDVSPMRPIWLLPRNVACAPREPRVLSAVLPRNPVAREGLEKHLGRQAASARAFAPLGFTSHWQARLVASRAPKESTSPNVESKIAGGAIRAMTRCAARPNAPS